ncbi:MAG: hypothetical protein FJ308_06410 [Planctomycetes bacterium]|nr:hypothetical protein [Planctomycetota bacterium]
MNSGGAMRQQSFCRRTEFANTLDVDAARRRASYVVSKPMLLFALYAFAFWMDRSAVYSQGTLEWDNRNQFARSEGVDRMTLGRGGLELPDFALLVDPPASLRPRLGRIAGIFAERCLGCHNDSQNEGLYSMATPLAMLKPGESQRPPMDSNAANPDSPLGEMFRRIVSTDARERMPKDAEPLDWEEVESIREWLVTGAVFDGAMDAPLESFLSVQLPELPRMKDYTRPHSVNAVALADEIQVVFASGYHEVLVWGFDGQLQGRIPTRGRFVADLEWNSVTSSLIISSGDPGKIGWVESVPWGLTHPSTENGNSARGDSARSRRVVHWTCRDIPLDISISPDGTRLGIGNQDGIVLVLDLISNSIVWREAAHAAAITSVDWSEDGLILLTSSRDRTAKSYDAGNGQLLTSYTDHERVVASIHSLKHGVITLDETGTIRLFPGLNASNSRASRSGFRQGTDKLAATQDVLVVPVAGALRRFKLRKEEVTESKGEDGKEKKKKNYSIDNLDSLDLTTLGIEDPPTFITISEVGREAIVAGFASGEIVVWMPEGNVVRRWQNQAHVAKP